MNQITIFYNDQKGNSKAPFFTGKIVFPDGTEQRVSLWTNVSQSGVTYYNGNYKPFETKPTPAPAQPEPVQAAPALVQDQPADPAFIQETIQEWEARTKADIPELGRQRLDPPRDVQATNAFYKKLKYNESKALINTFVNTPIDDITSEMAGKYYEARAYVNQYEMENQDLFLGSKI
jgi:hypothetical protein